jgi:hypothetical protein
MARIDAAQMFLGIALVVSLAACSRDSPKPSDIKAEGSGPYDGAIAFELTPVGNGSGPRQWLASYASAGKTAKFRIELGPGHSGDAEDKAFRVSFGKGRFLSEPGSDASVFLVDLKKALEAKTVPNKVERVAVLPFEFVILGENQSRTPDGGFNTKPPGDWMAMKIFLAGGEGEVFLNLNPATNKAEFSIKDADYGDIVMAELAKVV